MESVRCWRGTISGNFWGDGSSARDIEAGHDFRSESLLLDSEFYQAVIRRRLISMETRLASLSGARIGDAFARRVFETRVRL